MLFPSPVWLFWSLWFDSLWKRVQVRLKIASRFSLRYSLCATTFCFVCLLCPVWPSPTRWLFQSSQPLYFSACGWHDARYYLFLSSTSRGNLYWLYLFRPLLLLSSNPFSTTQCFLWATPSPPSARYSHKPMIPSSLGVIDNDQSPWVTYGSPFPATQYMSYPLWHAKQPVLWRYLPAACTCLHILY